MPEKAPKTELEPIEIVALFAEDWQALDTRIVRVEIPFKLHSKDPNVHHILTNEEYIVVNSAEPYSPKSIWDTSLSKYSLQKLAQAENVHLYRVPQDLVTLAAILNDAIDGDHGLIPSVFSEVGTMFRDIAAVYEAEVSAPTAFIGLNDIAFIKGRKEPILLPPFALNEMISGEDPAQSLRSDVFHNSVLDTEQRQILRYALEAFEVSYGSSS